jgi:hypothetical protein
VDAKSPGGLDELIAQLKARHDWIDDEPVQASLDCDERLSGR